VDGAALLLERVCDCIVLLHQHLELIILTLLLYCARKPSLDTLMEDPHLHITWHTNAFDHATERPIVLKVLDEPAQRFPASHGYSSVVDTVACPWLWNQDIVIARDSDPSGPPHAFLEEKPDVQWSRLPTLDLPFTLQLIVRCEPSSHTLEHKDLKTRILIVCISRWLHMANICGRVHHVSVLLSRMISRLLLSRMISGLLLLSISGLLLLSISGLLLLSISGLLLSRIISRLLLLLSRAPIAGRGLLLPLRGTVRHGAAARHVLLVHHHGARDYGEQG
jgi:hypothetical protein